MDSEADNGFKFGLSGVVHGLFQPLFVTGILMIGAATQATDFELVTASQNHMSVLMVVENAVGSEDQVRVRAALVTYQYPKGSGRYREVVEATGADMTSVQVGSIVRMARSKSERAIVMGFKDGLDMPLVKMAYFPESQQIQILSGSVGFHEFIGADLNRSRTYTLELNGFDRKSLSNIPAYSLDSETVDILLAGKSALHFAMGDMTSYLHQEVLVEHRRDQLNGPEDPRSQPHSTADLNQKISCRKALLSNIRETAKRGARRKSSH